MEIHVAGDQDAIFIAKRLLAISEECRERFGVTLEGFQSMMLSHYMHEQGVKSVEEKMEWVEKHDGNEVMTQSIVAFINCQTGHEV